MQSGSSLPPYRYSLSKSAARSFTLRSINQGFCRGGSDIYRRGEGLPPGFCRGGGGVASRMHTMTPKIGANKCDLVLGRPGGGGRGVTLPAPWLGSATVLSSMVCLNEKHPQLFDTRPTTNTDQCVC